MTREPIRGRKADISREISVVIPCLNEADTRAVCIDEARSGSAGDGPSH